MQFVSQSGPFSTFPTTKWPRKLQLHMHRQEADDFCSININISSVFATPWKREILFAVPYSITATPLKWFARQNLVCGTVQHKKVIRNPFVASDSRNWLAASVTHYHLVVRQLKNVETGLLPTQESFVGRTCRYTRQRIFLLYHKKSSRHA